MKQGLCFLLLTLSLSSPALTKAADGTDPQQADLVENETMNPAAKDEAKPADKGKTKPHAHLPQYQIIVGKPLPPLVISDYGELIIVNEEEVSYQAWHSGKALNRVQVIHYLAGRRSASKRHKNFSDQLEALELDFDKHHVTTIINADDAFLGTSKLVASRLDHSKREYPQISVVGDKTGIGAHTWSLKRKGSAIIIVDAKGSVVFFKEDKFSQQEIDSTLELLQTHMNQ